MKLTINGNSETVQLKQGTISELLAVKKVEMPEMVSVELNGNILRRADYQTTVLQENDQVEFLYFMGGGSPVRHCSR